MDAQTTVAETAALTALVQSVARLELEEEWMPESMLELAEVLDENRFIAARDGVRAKLIDPARECRVALTEHVAALIAACRPHADALGCREELEQVAAMAGRGGAVRQLETARAGDRLPGLVRALADAFTAERPLGD